MEGNMKGIIQIRVSTPLNPKYPVVHNSHVTVAFKVDEEALAFVGQEIAVKMVSLHDDGTCQAVKVAYDDHELKSISNREPHITVSCAEGVKPMHANEVIKTVGLPLSGEVIGVVEFKPL
jgi:hypothetical protein